MSARVRRTLAFLDYWQEHKMISTMQKNMVGPQNIKTELSQDPAILITVNYPWGLKSLVCDACVSITHNSKER